MDFVQTKLFHLVLRGSRLAGLELIEVPAANVQTALILIHAATEVGDVRLAGSGSLVAVGCVGAVVCRVGHGLGRLLGRSRGAATEEAADCVTDRGTDGDTAVVDMSV
jgi:hypothetical protein